MASPFAPQKPRLLTKVRKPPIQPLGTKSKPPLGPSSVRTTGKPKK